MNHRFAAKKSPKVKIPTEEIETLEACLGCKVVGVDYLLASSEPEGAVTAGAIHFLSNEVRLQLNGDDAVYLSWLDESSMDDCPSRLTVARSMLTDASLSWTNVSTRGAWRKSLPMRIDSIDLFVFTSDSMEPKNARSLVGGLRFRDSKKGLFDIGALSPIRYPLPKGEIHSDIRWLPGDNVVVGVGMPLLDDVQGLRRHSLTDVIGQNRQVDSRSCYVPQFRDNSKVQN